MPALRLSAAALRLPGARRGGELLKVGCSERASGFSTSASSSTPATPPPPPRPRVFSGAQPTGGLHLGNYVGALRQWAELQDSHDCAYSVVDLHAITLPHDADALAHASRATAAAFLAAGVDPDRSILYVQSHVAAHARAAWLLACCTPLGWLQRAIQFKEKARVGGIDGAGTGLLTYPVLMAADILIHDAALVPVGADQNQHLELCRDLALHVNLRFPGARLVPPKGLLLEESQRCMSLADATVKMSKSAPLDASRINLMDAPEVVRQKIKRAKTDAVPHLEFDNPDRPEAHNLLSIYQTLSGESKAQVATTVRDMRWSEFKPLLAELINDTLAPMQKRHTEISADPGMLDAILAKGARDAEERTGDAIERLHAAMGFLPRT